MSNYLDKKEFLRSFEIRPKGAFNIFLGAGASVTAGIPTTEFLIWRFKRKLYSDLNSIKEERFKDLQSELNRKTLQEFFDQKSEYPKRGDKTEYSFYFEKLYPKSLDRKLFIQNIVENINPTIGHRCLAEMFNNGRFNSIFTTNFDELVERSLASYASRSYKLVSPDNSHQVNDIGSVYPKIIKLHGDYRYDHLQNLTKETIDIDKTIRDHFILTNQSNGLIVVGYNGADESVLTTLKESLKDEKSFSFGLIWAIRKGSSPSAEVIQLVKQANELNGNSGFIEISGFDEFLFELYEKSGGRSTAIDQIANNLFNKKAPFVLSQASTDLNLIKLNSLKIINYPETLYSFETTLTNWKDLREKIKDKDIVASFFKRKTYAFGDLALIKSVFQSELKSDINLVDIENRIIRHENSFILGMFYDLIEKSITKDYGLEKSLKGERRYFDKKKIVKGLPSHFLGYEAIELQLFPLGNKIYLLLLPTIELIDTRKPYQEDFKLQKQELVNKILSSRYNLQVGQLLKDWLSFLQRGKTEIVFGLGEFKLIISNSFSYGGHKTNNKLDFFQGLQHHDESRLVFHSTDPNYNTAHPLKGLKNFGPYDHSLGETKSSIVLGVISPEKGLSKLLFHLNNLNNAFTPTTEKAYLIDYPGFHKIFKKVLEFPRNVTDKLCVTLKEEVTKMSLIEFYEQIKKKIDYFYTIPGDFDVLIVYIPEYWSRFRELKNENSYFDLHDSVKIYAAKKNIKVQFIEDKSINYPDKAKINWWLSLAIYVKANGIPWKHENKVENTAYVGIGYAVKNSAIGNQVVIGCSQLFDSNGIGLRFLMLPVEKPVFYHKNPYMSQEDARRSISQLRDIYFKVDPNSRLEKLVIHKTTAFTNEEISGILQASDGIAQIELLQIQQFNLWRAIRSFKNFSGGYKEDMFPIKRGTTLQLDDFSFLIWTHGSVTDRDIVIQNKNYYQGGRGIPSPLLIKRFYGTDSLDNITDSILSLTKMNWNGGQLYKSLPVTLDFSKNLSEIAKQSEALQYYPYDFRYFM